MQPGKAKNTGLCLAAAIAALAAAAGHAAAGGKAFTAFDLRDAALPSYADLGEPSGGLAGLAAAIAPALDRPSRKGSGLASYFQRIETPDLGPYDADTFFSQAGTVPLELSAIVAASAYEGFTRWHWGKSDFHFTEEGWFGKHTKYLGMDKLGHAYTTAAYADFFTQRIAHRVSNRTGAAVTGALLGFGVQAGVEVLDGFSPAYGFSFEDLTMDGLGAGFALLRNAVPGLSEKLDFRMEYWQSPYGEFNPTEDYEGQKYLLALKLSGFEAFRDTPLRYVELQAGYFARGFSDEARAHGVRRSRDPYFAIGFNLQQLLADLPGSGSVPSLAARRALESIQIPYTYVATKQN